jgi:hypothetical protein
MDPFSAATTVAGAVNLTSQVFNSMKSANDTVNNTTKYFKTGSLIDVTKAARVEPICLIDADVINLEYTSLICQTMESLFSGYYLQAVSLLGTVGSVTVLQRLAPLNPNRAAFENYKPDWRMSSESYKHRLPTNKNKQAIAMEAEAVDVRLNDSTNSSTKMMLEANNLSVGKVYDVSLKEGKDSVSIKIAVRLMVNSLPTSVMVNLFTFKDQFDMDLKERYHAWRSGRLGFIKDLILCQDLIEKHRTTLIKDKSGVYSQIVNRENSNLKAGLISKNPSLATASNLAIISTNTIAEVEQKLGAKFSNFKTRQTIFESTNLMIVAVVDKGFERVTFYHRGIAETTTVSVKDMKASSKSSGPDVSDILKAYMAGSAPL